MFNAIHIENERPEIVRKNDCCQMQSPLKYCDADTIKRQDMDFQTLTHIIAMKYFIYADPMPECVKECRENYSGKCFCYCFKSHMFC